MSSKNVAIEFERLSFSYNNGKRVLEEVNLQIQQKEAIYIVGPNGGGKTTLLKLILGLLTPAEGRIRIFGEPPARMLKKIGYVPQEGMLFSGTIESNLLYGDKDASSEILKESADIAQASEFIFSGDEGIRAEIAQGGSNVSGGQKQRLSIARALVKRPPIYIFDDSFSALDFRTDSALRRALKEKTGDATVLIVTQRVATVKNADQIIVLDEGRIAGKGTHQELMKSCQTYQEIASSQLSKEELL